ncbi:Y-family DNA polymerase [Enterococcus saccharolyticus]|uniref:Y-family DNA polymerase n=1 Tax=Enterococcus saccharolyticus TaxID=41997 RepID=UPI001E2B3C5E|nr:Y-family DNA polymerase [Enterococcus saccharolyticus]MCD5002652.1 Y-family DNA polymerase [Enterococcus saccharolyticus]
MPKIDYSQEPIRDILFIDVKSFYATVECVSRNLDPLNTLLVVMSHSDHTDNGLILASSPKAKEILHISNVTRAEHLPDHPDLLKVPPRMSFYIQENMKINKLFQQFVAEEDLLIYSIDESILDVTRSLNLFFPNKKLSRSQKRHQMARLIQQTVYRELGLVLTVGIGDNPLLAKLALDNAAKDNSPSFIAEWRYDNVSETVWKIPELTDFWGIGRKMKKRLYTLGIDTIYQLAHSDEEFLYQRLGIIGQQLYYHANGIDRTILAEKTPLIQEKSYGNSQVLPKNYTNKEEIKIVIGEMAEQVATRIRRHNCLTQCIHLYIGSAYGSKESSFSHQLKIDATDQTKELKHYCFYLFDKYYRGQAVRHIGISYSKLVYTRNRQLNLFDNPEQEIANERLDQIIDRIREKYGFTAIIHATSKLDGARSIARSHLVGGHHGGAGGLDGF